MLNDALILISSHTHSHVSSLAILSCSLNSETADSWAAQGLVCVQKLNMQFSLGSVSLHQVSLEKPSVLSTQLKPEYVPISTLVTSTIKETLL